jgi:hypothetical protein
MEPTNDNPNPSTDSTDSTAAATQYHGIGGLLDRIPRSTPRDAWASLALVSDPSERTAISEVGVMIRRDCLSDGIGKTRAKLPAAEIDAILMAAGYALSMMAGHIVRAAIVAASASHRNELPEPIRAVLEANAGRIGAADSQLPQMIRLASMLAGLPNGSSEAETEAARTRDEVLGGCVMMHSLACQESENLPMVGAWLVNGAISSLEAERRDAEREAGEGGGTDEG